MVCATDKDLFLGEEADVSILSYGSHKTDKSGSSTLLVESNALSTGLAECEWAASWFGVAKSLNYDLREINSIERFNYELSLHNTTTPSWT